MKDKLFANFSGKIVDQKPDHIEIAGYNDRDIMLIQAVAVHDGLNENGALFLKDDLQRAEGTLRGKPLKIRFVSDGPTGHGYDPETNTFDELVQCIGFINDSWGYVSDETGRYEVEVWICMWQKYYPEIAGALRQLHAEGNLKFSIEAERDFEITEEGYRRCYNINFTGLCVVKNPAFTGARSKMVAEILNHIEGGSSTVNFEEKYNEMVIKNEALSSELATVKEQLNEATTQIEDAKSELASTKEELVTITGTLKDATTELDALKSAQEQAEKEALGKERQDKLAKYGVEKSVEELAELSKDQFVDELAEAVDNYKPVVGGYYSNEGEDRSDNKNKLLGLVRGFGKIG